MRLIKQSRKYVLLRVCFVLVLLAGSYFIMPLGYSWGFYAHKNINREAVFALPAPLDLFYKKNADYISLHAVDPDKRRYADSTEAPHHFIDIDHYGSSAFAQLPRYWAAAEKKYSTDSLNKYGTLPWSVIEWEEKLTVAFKKMDVNEILRASSYLGHYVADAHVPLHTVSNYNGQKSEQQGIHALWESAIPQTFGDQYKYSSCKGVYLKDPEEYIWEILHRSYLLAPAVLAAEGAARSSFGGKSIFIDTQNKKFDPNYVAAFNKALNGMVEKQMTASVSDVASFWYTAWVNAGQPDMSKLQKK